MRGLLLVLLILLFLSLGIRPVRAQSASQASEQVLRDLFELDKQLLRNLTCQARPAGPVKITLDGSGRYSFPFGSRERPLYWEPPVSKITISNEPSSANLREPNELVLESPKDRTRFSWPIKAGASRDLDWATAWEASNNGVLQLEVLRNDVLISTLWLLLQAPDVVLLSADGPIDPAYSSSIAPAYMPCDFKLQYVPDAQHPQPPPVVITAAEEELQLGEVITWKKTLDPLKRSDGSVQLILLKNGRAASVLWLTQKAPRGVPSPGGASKTTGTGPAQGPGEDEQAGPPPEVVLDRLGISTQVYLNRRQPVYIPPGIGADLVFTNHTSDREYIVTFSGIPEDARPELIRAGLSIGSCRGGQCDAVIYVRPGGQAALRTDTLRQAYARSATGSTVKFSVAFYDSDTTPVNSDGYLTFFEEAFYVQPASATAWTGALSVSLLQDPDLTAMVPEGAKAVALTPSDPLGRNNRTHVSGSATVGIKQNLKNLADFQAELTAKSGDLGGENPVKASKYLATVYTSYGATLTGGRLDLASPTQAIAFQESGDALAAGIAAPPGYLSVGYVFRKQSTADAFTAAKVQDAISQGASQLDRNNHDVVFQWRDVGLGRFRNGLYGVFGEASRGRVRTLEDGSTELVPFDARAWSAGVETNVSISHSQLTLGLYHSERSSKAPADVRLAGDDAQGNVGLLSYRYTNIDHDRLEGSQLASDFTLTLSAGRGSRYVGENQAFAPDSLFLSKLAGLLRDDAGPIGPGLTNKQYYGLTFSTPKMAPGKGTTTLQLHQYVLNQARAGSRNLGTEASIELRVEDPKGIRYQLSAAGFWPGRALNPDSSSRPLITKFQFVLKAGVTVSMQ